MKKTKSMLTLIMAFLMVAGMVACGEEGENSSVVDNSDVISEIESKADTTTTTTTTTVESVDIPDSEIEINDYKDYGGGSEIVYEGPSVLKSGYGVNGSVYEPDVFLVSDDDWKKDLYIIQTTSIHKMNKEIEYSISDTSEWLEKSKSGIVEDFDAGTNYCTFDEGEEIIIESQEEVTINDIKYIKINGYFRAHVDGEEDELKCLFTGYLTVYQSDNSDEYGYIEPDVCSIIATMPEDKADMEKMQEVADHAAETLEFLK